MMFEIPDTPLGAIRAVMYILAMHRIEIGLLKIEPATLYEIMNETKGWEFMPSTEAEFEKGICGRMYNIPFEQKRPS